MYTLCSWLCGRGTPLERRAVLGRRCWARRLRPERQATQRYTKLALCLEPVRETVASVSRASQCAQSHQKPRRLLSSVLDRLSSARSLGKSSEKRSMSRFSSAGDQGWEELQRRGGPYSRASHSVQVRKDWMALLRSTGAGSNLRVTIAGASKPYVPSL